MMKSSPSIDEVLNRYPRYRRDQLEILRSMAQNEPNWIEQALEKCRKENLYSANDFRDIVYYLKKLSPEKSTIAAEPKNIFTKRKSAFPIAKRPLNAYTRILGGNKS